MDLRDAIRMAGQILDEERIEPTVGYCSTETVSVVGALAALAGPLAERGKKHPRSVQEQPEKFQFTSTNFDLLCALLDQLPEQSRPALLRSTLPRISEFVRHFLPPLTGHDQKEPIDINVQLQGYFEFVANVWLSFVPGDFKQKFPRNFKFLVTIPHSFLGRTSS